MRLQKVTNNNKKIEQTQKYHNVKTEELSC